MAYRNRNIPAMLALMTVLLSSCDYECVCPPGCTKCKEGCCECCSSKQSPLIVSLSHSDGIVADSYYLEVADFVRDFHGNSVSMFTKQLVGDVVAYNNDSKSVIVEYGIATTYTVQEADTIHNMPDNFYSFCSSQMILPVDSLHLILNARVFKYDVFITLENNDGRVIGCPFLFINGVACGYDILKDKRIGCTSHKSATNEQNGVITSVITTWGCNSECQTIGIVFKQANGYCLKTYDITEQMLDQPSGGIIRLSIDVLNEVEHLEPGDNCGVYVGLDDWLQEDFSIGAQ